MKTASLIAIALAGVILAAAAPPKDPANGCPAGVRERIDASPMQAGPLRLTLLYCVNFQSSSSGVSDPILSPDGKQVAQWHRGSPAPVEMVAFDRPDAISVSNRVTFRNFAPMGDAFGTSPDAVAWSRDSRALWSARQDMTTPGGWAISGLIPIAIDSKGAVRDLPRLRHKAGPLDGLLWAGNDGLALAQFGTRGQYYRPEHNDLAPTVAMVDAARGRVLASYSLLNVPSLRARIKSGNLIISGATATILPDRRIRAVVRFSRWGQRPPNTVASKNFEPIMHPGVWLVWTQGETPKLWAPPNDDERGKPAILSPDGLTLLVIRQLQPDGMQMSCRIPCRGPPPPPPTPVSGPVAELIDVASRRLLWRTPAKATQFWSQNSPPAISDDGHYALIEVPPDGDRAPIALIDMRNGRIVQRIAPSHTWSYPHKFGFAAGGRKAWVMVANQMLIYKLNRR